MQPALWPDRSYPGADAPPAGFLTAALARNRDAAVVAGDSRGRRVPAWDRLASQRPWAFGPFSSARLAYTLGGVLFFSPVFLQSTISHFSQDPKLPHRHLFQNLSLEHAPAALPGPPPAVPRTHFPEHAPLTHCPAEGCRCHWSVRVTPAGSGPPRPHFRPPVPPPCPRPPPGLAGD